jgi:hypothetical protein
LLQCAVGEEFLGQLIVVFCHGAGQIRIIQNALYLPDCILGNEPFELDGFESLWLDIGGVDRIIVDHQRFAEIDRLQEGVAKPFHNGRIGHNITVGINILERINFSAIGGKSPRNPDNIR